MGKAQSPYSDEEIADAIREPLCLGCKELYLVIPSANDFSWTTADGAVRPEAVTPDPLTGM